MFVADLARMILADGKIDKEEEKLMKSFMLICDPSEDLYETVLEKAKKIIILYRITELISYH